MFDFVNRCWNTISAIEYSNSYEDCQEEFNKAIDILQTRARNNDDSEFTDEEFDILDSVFTTIELYG